MATTSRPTGISGIAWPPRKAGWCLSPTIADRPDTATNSSCGIVPEIVSRPGKDILAGVDALVKDGIADPDHLTVGGYSYGGYMTNWLITQTTRFKAAVTGAGAVEHAGNWGNDDMTVDDAYFLGGDRGKPPSATTTKARCFR